MGGLTGRGGPVRTVEEDKLHFSDYDGDPGPKGAPKGGLMAPRREREERYYQRPREWHSRSPQGEVRCHNCKKLGHWQPHCPEPIRRSRVPLTRSLVVAFLPFPSGCHQAALWGPLRAWVPIVVAKVKLVLLHGSHRPPPSCEAVMNDLPGVCELRRFFCRFGGSLCHVQLQFPGEDSTEILQQERLFHFIHRGGLYSGEPAGH